MRKAISIRYSLLIMCLSFSLVACVMITKTIEMASSGEMYDNNRNLIEAHDGGMIKIGNTYYLYGNDRTYYNSGNSQFNKTFYRIRIYSSTDLVHWKFVNDILTYNTDSAMNGNIVERPKIMYNETTGKFVMYFHYDDYSYQTAHVGIAICNTVDGNYTFVRHFAPEGLDSRDMGIFKDSDGTGYLICTTDRNKKTRIFRLTPDYLAIDSQVTDQLYGEGIAVFKRNNVYYGIFSGYTGWSHNDNWYVSAPSLAGPWSDRVTLATPGTRTYESQITYVIAIPGSRDTTYMYMGDKWVNGAINSRYLWLPLSFNGSEMHLDFYKSWKINTVKGTWIK
jgi:beta-xylosidase